MAARKLKPFTATTIAAPTDDAWVSGRRHRARQVRVAVLATSRKAAAEALGMRPADFKWSGGETGNQTTIDALAAHPPGTVLVHPTGNGTVVGGQTWWVPRPNADEFAERLRKARENKLAQDASVAEMRAEAAARAEHEAQTRRRSAELVAEAADALESLGYRPDLVGLTHNGAVTMPSEMFSDLLRRALEHAEMETL